jgi:hypothetical protein
MTFPISDIAQRFAGGRTYPDYLEHMQKHRGMIQKVSGEVRLSPGDEEFFRSLRAPINALAISEDWCPDCAQNLPVLEAIAKANPAIQLRLVGREDNLDLLAHALKGDRKCIPTFFFFDADWNELGHWVERPVGVEERLGAWDRNHPAPAEPDRTHHAWTEYRTARSNHRNELFFQQHAWRDTISELRSILAGEMFSNVASLAVHA